MPRPSPPFLLLSSVVVALSLCAEGAWALDQDAVIRKLEDLAEAARLPKFTQPVFDLVDRAAEKAAVEAITEVLPKPLRSPANSILGDVLSGRVRAKARIADLERIRAGTPVRWERRGPIRIPVPDIPLVDVDIPLVDKVGEVGPLPMVVPEFLAR
ncbi:MAG: hypothetical protein PVF51_04925 [Nitrospirota bacterium]|jgi:hypothetical protein